MTNRFRTKALGILLSLLAMASAVCAEAAPGQTGRGGAAPTDPDTVVAEIGDRQIRLRDVERAWEDRDGASYLRMQQQIYEARREALEHLIGDYLLEEAARERGVTRADLLARERERRLRPVTEDEIATAFQSLQARMPPGTTLDQARRPIREFLEAQREEEVRLSLLEELRGDRPIRILLDPPRLALETSPGEPAMGPSAAAVEIVEYTDYQ